ncbi:MsnO8 family LLM class oxidoreductase [Glycomyces buryatensis]|uniref:MsnO8 family LLM class oxidoreductase n=1 Tax=Glycomyces buryatensis TaxID=2570927 RepID=A0A4S8PR44_9ACTN|nr:MsnO8 family LLM class oxidoreductase [Glycomyces buryatensis]THV33657.1 MsnO8 family LLM class oxidoreductase [Glycomyces buryatensis]
MSSQRPVRLSLLDRAVIAEGETPAETLRDVVGSAKRAEELGYHRYWVAEHHSVPGIAGSAPTVLAAAIAAATARIRVGTGGVMLPNHRPLVVAEQFGVLEALFEGRIDMGLGRTLGFVPAVRAALGHDLDEADDFDELLTELLGYFTGDQQTYPGVHARPGEGLRPEAFVLAVGSGGEYAARHGLGLVIAPARGLRAMGTKIEEYRRDFRPSAWRDEPYVVVAQTVAVAESCEAAQDLLLPEAWSTALSRTRGEFSPLRPPAEIRSAEKTGKESEYLWRGLSNAIYGTEEEVAPRLKDLIEAAGADEILVGTSTYDRKALFDSHRRLAELAVGL